MTSEQTTRTAMPEDLETSRMRLRRASPADAAIIFESYARDPEVARFVLFRPDQTLEDVRRFLQKAAEAWEAGTGASWTMTLKPGGDMVGMIDLRIEAEANLGYVLARRFWNRGLATEAVRAVIACAFLQPDIHRVWAVCEVNNTASARVLEKAGMICEGKLERHMVFPNLGAEPRDVLKYGIAREEWKE